MARRSVLQLVAAVTALVPVSSCAGEEATRADMPHVLVVTIDTLRADHLGCYGYFRDTSPFLDGLAKESVLFERCYTPVAQTLPTHTTLLTGLAPHEHGVLANVNRGRMYRRAQGAASFAEAVRSIGYETVAYVAAEPLKAGTGIEAGFERWWEPADTHVRARQIVDRALEGYRELGDRPTFTWVHLFDPHRPYDPPEEYRGRYRGVGVEEQVRYLRRLGISEDAAVVGRSLPSSHSTPEEDHDLYDGEIRYADDQLERLFEGLRELGLWDDLVVVITSDHGEGLWQHGLVSHGHIWLESLHVPLLLRVPGLTPGRHVPRIETRDILPTLVARIPALARSLEGWPVVDSGRDALATGVSPRAHLAQFPSNRTPMTFALVRDDWRLLHTRKAPTALYDLSKDPHELESLHEDRPQQVAEMNAQIEDLVTEQRLRGAELGAGLPVPVEEARLEALGEIGYGGAEDD